MMRRAGGPQRDSREVVSMFEGGIWLVVSFLRHLGHVSAVDKVVIACVTHALLQYRIFDDGVMICFSQFALVPVRFDQDKEWATIPILQESRRHVCGMFLHQLTNSIVRSLGKSGQGRRSEGWSRNRYEADSLMMSARHIGGQAGSDM